MIINLSEIPSEGRSFICNERTAEFNESLNDLIGKGPYEVDFFIQPVGNIYQVTGKIYTEQTMSCTRCLREFPLKLNESIHELLIPGKEMPRTGKESKVNHTSELETEGPSTTVVSYPNFDPSSMLRDIVALAQPAHPICTAECLGICQFCGKNKNEAACGCVAPQPETFVAKSPFAKLRDIKFN